VEMKIKDKFYVMEAETEKGVYDTSNAAIEALTIIAKGKPQLNPEKVNIYEVNTVGQKWEIKTIPWAQIAMELLKKK